MGERSVAGVEVSLTRYGREICDWVNARFYGNEREASYETVRWIGHTFGIDDKLGITTEVVVGG